jgi:cytochrome c peroxidase
MRPRFITILSLVAAVAATGCSRTDTRVDPARLSAFAPLPDTLTSPANPVTAAKVALGRMLFYDTRLSQATDVSCNSCHNLATYGVDGRRVSVGFNGQEGTRNSPTVYNAAGHVAQFWDGRAASVEDQAKGPILNPAEMAMPNAATVLARLTAVAAYRDAFRGAFPGERSPITYDNVARAIGAFERTLVTPSRWDAFLKGDRKALTPVEIAGFKTFDSLGCSVCHNGPYVGGEMFQRVGTAQAWPELTADSGRVAVTHRVADRNVFKVPSLRNIVVTGPYFHNGRTAQLDEAVRLMARHQLGRELTDRQAQAIITWLRSLTGPLPPASSAPPALPADD